METKRQKPKMRMALSPVESNRAATVPEDVRTSSGASERFGRVATLPPAVGEVRSQLVSEIEGMARFLLSDGGAVNQKVAHALERLEATDEVPLSDLIAAHNELAKLCPAKPRAVAALYEGRKTGVVTSLLGPTPMVRRLTLTSILFALIFFGTSLSGEINVETMKQSIYESSGQQLAIKLVLIMSAAGLGASFAVLFDVWDDLATNRFDPISESANWMRIGLGVVAGLILAEIIGSETVLTDESGGGVGEPAMPLISDPLLALIGGFSATVLHMVMTSIVDAFRRAFTASGRQDWDDRALEALAGKLNVAVSNSEAARGAPAPADQTAPKRHDRSTLE